MECIVLSMIYFSLCRICVCHECQCSKPTLYSNISEYRKLIMSYSLFVILYVLSLLQSGHSYLLSCVPGSPSRPFTWTLPTSLPTSQLHAQKEFREGSMRAASASLGRVPYGEESRKYRRTIFKERWECTCTVWWSKEQVSDQRKSVTSANL